MRYLSAVVLAVAFFVNIYALPQNDIVARSVSDSTSDPLTSSVTPTSTQGVFGGHFGPGPVKLPTTTTTQGVYGGHFGPGPVKLPSTTSHTSIHYGPGPVKLPSTTSHTSLHLGPGPVKLPSTTSTSTEV